MVREGSFILSGYKGVDIWFAPVPYFDHGAMAQKFKVLEMTKTKFTSYYKAVAFSFIIMAVCSFFFWALVWRMGPIPSPAYPFVHKMWPLFSMTKALWATATIDGTTSWMLEALKLKFIISGAVGAIIVYAVISLLNLPMALFYGMIMGIPMIPHDTIPLFIGALLGRYFFSRRFGKDKWKSYAPIVLAGYGCGVGLIGMFSVAFALIVKSVSQIIF